MSSAVSTQPQISASRSKHVLFSVISLMIVYVLYHNEHFVLDAGDPAWPHVRPLGPWLLPHALLGSACLLLGLSQFSNRLRTRYTKLHRVFGRVYVVAVFVVAPLGAYIQYLDESTGSPRSETFAAITFAALWTLATGMAFWCIRRRRIEQHRQWMSRSIAMALVFLEIRVLEGLTGWDTLGPAVDATVMWGCVAFAYPLADLALHVDASLQGRGRSSLAAG